MGRFPSFEESQISLGQGGQEPFSPEADLIRADTTSGLGKLMMGFGDALATEEAENASNQARTAAEEAHIEAEKEAKADGSDFQQIFNDKYQTKVGKIRETLDPLAANKADKFLKELDTNVNIMGMKTAFEKKVEHFKVMTEENTRASVGNIINDPRLAKQYIAEVSQKFEKHREAGIPDSLLSATEARIKDQLAAGYVEGMLQKGYSNPAYLGQLARELKAQESEHNIELTSAEKRGFGLLQNGTPLISYKYKDGNPVDPQMSEVLRNISPDMRIQALNKIRSHIEAGTKERLSLVTQGLDQLSKMVARGQPLPANYIQMSQQRINGTPADLKPQFQAQLETIKDADMLMRKAIDKGMGSITSDLTALRPAYGIDSDLVAAAKEKRLEFIQGSLTKLAERQADDGIGFGIEADVRFSELYALAQDGKPESYSNLMAYAEPYFKARGIPMSYVTKQDGQLISTEVMNGVKLKSPEAITQAMQKYEAKYGDYFNDVMNDVYRANAKELPKAFPLLGVIDNPNTRGVLVKNMAQEATIREQFKEMRFEVPRKQLEETLESEMRGLNKSLFNNPEMTADPALNAINHAVEVEAMRRVTNGEKPADAVKAAKKAIFDDNFTLVAAGRNEVFIPNSHRYNIELIKGFFNYNAPTAEGPSNALFQANREWKLSNVKGYSPDPERIRAWEADWRANVRIQNVGFQGVELVRQLPNGQVEIIRDKDGNRMMKSFDEMNRKRLHESGYYAPYPKEK